MIVQSSLRFPVVAPRAVVLGAIVFSSMASGRAHAQWVAVDLNPPFYLAEPTVAIGGASTQTVGTAYVIGFTSNQYHAFLWPWNSSYVDLNPAGSTGSGAVGTTGTRQFGNATFGSAMHAGFWSGTAASWIDLHPAGATSSRVFGFVETQQVGTATFGSATHAGRWNGTAASWTDLNPAGASGSIAYATSGTQQVGSATFASSTHAGLWNGTAASWVDLNPASATESAAKFVAPNVPGEQVGYARFGGNNHAGLWHGTAGSWVDLNPAGATSSQVNGISSDAPGQQVGQATIGGTTRAGFWNGTAASWVDLNPAGATASAALAIFGSTQAGYATWNGYTHPGVWHGTAASWEPLPFPAESDKGGGWSPWSPSECSSLWTDGIRLYASGYVTRWHYVGSVQYTNAVLWWRPLCALPGDMNLDSLRDGADVQAFLNCFLGAGGNCSCADVDASTVVDSSDIAAFVSALMS